ncbi:MAG TPA: 50S ribosomal protein L21 [Ignavibacteriaceae bacterium]|jgi:large subunit ribosomal protein L21|nr:50S ribosomal protein L21 [Ignavibacteriaceae bacterium]
MLAVVDILGQQFKVAENEKHYVPKIEAEPETEITFDSVLLYTDETGTKIGTPFLTDVKVQAKVIEHVKDDKVIVFKKKRRKSYRRLKGHRQNLTRIEVIKIG